MMHADGSGKRNLTQTPGVHELYPQASPDGRKICFLADVPRDGDNLRSIYVMDTEGQHRRLIAEKARQPCWSPDGRRIAFVKQEFDRFRIADYASKGLYIFDLESGTTEEVKNPAIEHLYNLTWSQDGNWIISTVHGGLGFSHAIVAIAVSGDRVVDLKIPGCRPTVSPDGARITWSSDDHTVNVAKLSLANGQPSVSDVQVVYGHESLHLYHPDFSPDGNYVTFSAGPGGRMPKNGPGTHVAVAEMIGVRGNWNVFVRRIDPTAGGVGPVVALTDDASLSNKEADWLPVRSGLAQATK
jgi:Tol biopolymer transport system component